MNNTITTLNTEYARLCRQWAYLHTKQRTSVEDAAYKRVCAEMERIEFSGVAARRVERDEAREVRR